MKQLIAILLILLILLTFFASCSIDTNDAANDNNDSVESALKSEPESTTGIIDSADTTTVDDELIPKHPHDNVNIDEKLASEIKKAYIIDVYNKLAGSDRNPLKAEDITVQVYVNTTAGKNFVMMGDGRPYSDGMRYVEVAAQDQLLFRPQVFPQKRAPFKKR